MKCERCGASTKGFNIFDYCTHCSKNLCSKCMSEGCCGKVPADSGAEDTYPEDMDAEEEKK